MRRGWERPWWRGIRTSGTPALAGSRVPRVPNTLTVVPSVASHSAASGPLQLRFYVTDQSAAILPVALATWASSNPSVVTVDQHGGCTVVGNGTATITATVNGVSGTCVMAASLTAPYPTDLSTATSRLTFGGNSHVGTFHPADERTYAHEYFATIKPSGMTIEARARASWTLTNLRDEFLLDPGEVGTIAFESITGPAVPTEDFSCFFFSELANEDGLGGAQTTATSLPLIEQIASLAKARGYTAVLYGLPAVTNYPDPPNGYDEHRAAVLEALRNPITRAAECPSLTGIVDIAGTALDSYVTDYVYYTDDATHLEPPGAMVIASAIHDELEALTGWTNPLLPDGVELGWHDEATDTTTWGAAFPTLAAGQRARIKGRATTGGVPTGVQVAIGSSETTFYGTAFAHSDKWVALTSPKLAYRKSPEDSGINKPLAGDVYVYGGAASGTTTLVAHTFGGQSTSQVLTLGAGGVNRYAAWMNIRGLLERDTGTFAGIWDAELGNEGAGVWREATGSGLAIVPKSGSGASTVGVAADGRSYRTFSPSAIGELASAFGLRGACKVYVIFEADEANSGARRDVVQILRANGTTVEAALDTGTANFRGYDSVGTAMTGGALRAAANPRYWGVVFSDWNGLQHTNQGIDVNGAANNGGILYTPPNEQAILRLGAQGTIRVFALYLATDTVSSIQTASDLDPHFAYA